MKFSERTWVRSPQRVREWIEGVLKGTIPFTREVAVEFMIRVPEHSMRRLGRFAAEYTCAETDAERREALARFAATIYRCLSVTPCSRPDPHGKWTRQAEQDRLRAEQLERGLGRDLRRGGARELCEVRA